MKLAKKIFLGALVFALAALLGTVYMFFTFKNKEVEVKIGENSFKVEVAETSGQQAKGLSFRDSLDKNSGMLFEFGSEARPSFWMMGMRFPIDIIWIKNNKVVGIEKNALAPEKGALEAALKVYNPPESVDRVLEINAGLSDKMGIKPGDKFVIIK